MAATGMYKLEDGKPHPTNCFPARSLLQPQYKEGAGHWEVARNAAEQTKFEWWFGSKATRVRWKAPGNLHGPQRLLGEKTLTGTLLMKLHHVKNPSDLCSVDINNRNFVSAKEEDFEQFESVAYVNATENLLTLEVFRKFPALRELELSLNGLRNLKVNAEDFPRLEILDLSYNNLSPEDIRALGVLHHLKALHLTANGLSSLPLDLAVPDSNGRPRFPALEVLFLDDNQLSNPNVFASLANLRNLKQLNLDRNGIREVPYLHYMENSCFSIHPLSAKSGIREGLRTRKSAEIQRKQGVLSGRSDQVDHGITQNSTDPDRTEVLFPTDSPGPSVQADTPSSRSVSKMSSTSLGQEFALPLTELRYLSLANNEIENEEDLLAVALFPSLTELTFYGNPFTTARSGDPPLLTSFLQKQLGIKLVRKKISKLEKPRIFIPIKANRKVKSPLPKVRKHPMVLEAPLETSLWELWTATGSDIALTASLDKSEPLPPISQVSSEKKLSGPHLSFQDELSEFPSMVTFPSEDSTIEPVPEIQTSLDYLCGLVPTMVDQILSASLSPSELFVQEQSQSELTVPTTSASAEDDLPPSPSATQERSPSETDAPVGAPSTEQERSEFVPPSSSSGQEEDLSEHPPPTGPPLTDEDPSQILQAISSAAGLPGTPPNSPTEQQAPSEPIPSTGSPPGEQDLPESLPTVGSPSEGQNLPETSPSAESLGELKPEDILSFLDGGPNLSEPVSQGRPSETNLSGLGLPTGPSLEEWDLSRPVRSRTRLSPVQSLSETVSQDLSGIIPPANSLLFEPGQGEPTPLTLLPDLQDLLEQISSHGASSEDLPALQLQFAASLVIQDQPEPDLPTDSSFREPGPPDSVPPTGPPITDQDFSESLPPPDEQIQAGPLPSGGDDQTDTLPPAVPASPESHRSDTELVQSSFVQQELYKCVTEVSSLTVSKSLARGVSWAEPLLEGPSTSQLGSHERSSSRDVHLLYERDLSQTSFSRGQLDKPSSSESLTTEQFESFFMTQMGKQLEEDSESPENVKKEEMPCEDMSALQKPKPQEVPERYKGYEELLSGPTDPDFIEPRGIQQNVKALEWALRHPLVYRNSKARLDSFQKPYVPTEKKAWRVPVPPIQKTKAEQIDELLQRMRTSNNIIELPLVCVLRRKKSNWREYREALTLLKDFRKQYKLAVDEARQASSARKRQSGRIQKTQSRTHKTKSSKEELPLTPRLRSRTGVKASIKMSPSQPTKCDQGQDPPSGRKMSHVLLGERT